MAFTGSQLQYHTLAMKMRNNNAGIVYSTESGKHCAECHALAAQCSCRKGARPLPGDGTVRLLRETKGRKGKGVTLVVGVPLEPEGLKKLATTLKQKCASGGSVKEGVIEIQGDHRDMLEREMVGLGYRVKRAGG